MRKTAHQIDEQYWPEPGEVCTEPGHEHSRGAISEPGGDWRDRVDPVLAEAFGDGTGPLPIRLHPDTPFGPAVEVTWMHGSVLLVGIYTTDRKGIVYRWDNGLDQPPTVIDWDLDGPECGCES